MLLTAFGSSSCIAIKSPTLSACLIASILFLILMMASTFFSFSSILVSISLILESIALTTGFFISASNSFLAESNSSLDFLTITSMARVVVLSSSCKFSSTLLTVSIKSLIEIVSLLIDASITCSNVFTLLSLIWVIRSNRSVKVVLTSGDIDLTLISTFFATSIIILSIQFCFTISLIVVATISLKIGLPLLASLYSTLDL